jgi:hypothetical protein
VFWGFNLHSKHPLTKIQSHFTRVVKCRRFLTAHKDKRNINNSKIIRANSFELFSLIPAYLF